MEPQFCQNIIENLNKSLDKREVARDDDLAEELSLQKQFTINSVKMFLANTFQF